MRQILPIVGAEVGAYFGGLRRVGLSWWRRALVRTGQALIRLAQPQVYNFGYSGGQVVGKAVDPERQEVKVTPVVEQRFKPEEMAFAADANWNQPRHTFKQPFTGAED